MYSSTLNIETVIVDVLQTDTHTRAHTDAAIASQAHRNCRQFSLRIKKSSNNSHTQHTLDKNNGETNLVGAGTRKIRRKSAGKAASSCVRRCAASIVGGTVAAALSNMAACATRTESAPVGRGERRAERSVRRKPVDRLAVCACAKCVSANISIHGHGTAELQSRAKKIQERARRRAALHTYRWAALALRALRAGRASESNMAAGALAAGASLSQ